MRFFNVMGLLFPKFEKFQKTGILVSAAIMICGCSDKMFDNPELKPDPVIEKVTVLSRNLIQIKYQPTFAPNRYDAQITWPAFDGIVKFYDEKKTSLTEEPIRSNEFTIEDLEGGTERTFILETLSKDKLMRTQIELTLLPPKDVVFSENFSATKNLDVVAGRIFISDNVTILSNEFCLNFEFNELILGNNVKFYNFEPNAKAAPESNGRNGGCVKLKGKSAKGFLKIFSNSEQGGDGVLGFPRCLGTHEAECYYDCWGTNGGHSGRRGTFQIDLETSDNFDFDFKILEIPGGVRGEKNPSLTRKQRSDTCVAFKGNGRERYLKCDVEPTAGSDAMGGKICFKIKTGNNYECIEKN